MNLLNKKMYKYKGEKIFYKKKKSFFEIYNNGDIRLLDLILFLK